MIQPIKNEPSTWSLCWVDLAEPLPVEDDFYLPTVLLLVGPEFEPLAAPGIFAELDQIQAEEWVAHLFDDLGVPDELLVWKAQEWEPGDWKYFARDWKTKVRLVAPPPHEAKLQTQLTAARGPASPGATRTAIAAGLVRNVSRLHSARKRRAALEKAVELDPSNTEARAELADMEFQAGRYERSLEMAERVTEIDAALLRRRGADWWNDRSTRPVLRAIFGMMLSHWHLGRPAEAAAEGRRLLGIDARDHLGARFYLPLFYLLAGDHEEAVSFFRHYAKHYPKDMPNAWLGFAWALTLCLAGDDQGARRKYREAIVANIYVAPRLLGERPPPEDIYHPSQRDEPQSAAEFAGSFGALWDREPAAMRILRETAEEMQSEIAVLVERREALAELMDQRYDPDYRAHWTKLCDEEEAYAKRVAEGGEA